MPILNELETGLPNTPVIKQHITVEMGFGDVGFVDTIFNGQVLMGFKQMKGMRKPGHCEEAPDLMVKEYPPVILSFPFDDPSSLDVFLSALLYARNKNYPDAKPFEAMNVTSRKQKNPE